MSVSDSTVCARYICRKIRSNNWRQLSEGNTYIIHAIKWRNLIEVCLYGVSL